MNPTVTIFIPAFNEMDSLRTSVEVLLAKMDELGVNTEILIVDDGSQDGTAQLADDLSSQHERVYSTHHAYNLGIGRSFRSAVELARGEWMIFIPADLALHPSELGRYFEATPQADIVVGLRSDRSDYTWLRHLVSWTNIHLIQALFGMKLRQFQYISMYRVDVLRRINIEYWRSAFFLPEILIKARDQGYRLEEVEIRYAPRLNGKPTGAKLELVLLTVLDIFHFWLRWKFFRRKLESDLVLYPRRTRSPRI